MPTYSDKKSSFWYAFLNFVINLSVQCKIIVCIIYFCYVQNGR